MPYKPSPTAPPPPLPPVSSPKKAPPNPNINPFSALSPHLERRPLLPVKRPFVSYSRKSLLAIARRCSFHRPESMMPLDAWFGLTSQPADPAIASIGPSARGGFGEGFGFGGGIGGRNVGRGGNRIGRVSLSQSSDISSRRQNETQAEVTQAQMSRFTVKPHEKHEPRPPFSDRRPKREGEWRKQDFNRTHRNQTTHHEEAEPAWMDDNSPFGNDGPVASDIPDSLVHFTPGEDMIAAHRKDRVGGQWREGPKPLVSFFGPDQTMDVAKPVRALNAADYLLPNRVPEERTDTSEEPSNGFSSRFQKFFGAPREEVSSRPYQSPPIAPVETVVPERVDDHMSRLMGLLSAKSPPPAANPNFHSPHPYPSDARQPFYAQNRGPYPAQPVGPPDALQLLNHAQHRPPPFPMAPSHQLLREIQHTPYPDRNTPQYPNPSYPYSHYPAPPPQLSRPPPQLNTAQQDMLATLFSGLPRGPGQ